MLFPAGLFSFLIKSFVACCSIAFLTKFFFLFSVLILGLKGGTGLLKSLFDLKGFFFTEKDFFPEVDIDVVSIFFFKFDEIVSVFFYLYP